MFANHRKHLTNRSYKNTLCRARRIEIVDHRTKKILFCESAALYGS